jgi:hypothetical protein
MKSAKKDWPTSSSLQSLGDGCDASVVLLAVLLGPPCSWGLLLTSLLFAGTHVLLRGEPQAILVVFPGLAFSGWIFRMDAP